MPPYRLLLTLAAPVVALRLLREPDARAERLGGNGPADRPPGPLFWLHGASNGELASARGLIERILARLPDARLVVTCNTETGRALVAGWGLDRVAVRLAPLDYRPTLRRFLAAWRPDALILVESELWPNRIAEMARLGRPVLVVGARLSRKSAARWARLPGLIRPMLARVAFLSAQDAASRDRFIALGLDAPRAGPVVDLKSADLPATDADPAALARLAPLFPRAKTVLAASTHEGEERVVLAGFARAHATDPDLRLILAPRHPRRAPEIADEIARSGLAHAPRSTGELPGPDTPVYLADTMGEMALWYRRAGLTFVGGSLVDKGGHTPFEPAAHGSALLHGPHVANFARVFAALDAAGAAREVDGADAIAAALSSLDAEAQAAMAGRAREVIAELRAAGTGLDPILQELARLTGEPALATPASDESSAHG
ncbi:3-deoxy-D-manno-octulosonic-acid transferase [Rhodovulum sp. ES.010]|uniref:3-deoxy-D-manno-octulosonic acid transferase n=1 Tax=Rhodovulum sp. ES.010 TaxID=1882821 RepID=UPI0009263393|nr:3-deoxy-D-manno-octulosonic acid transferase [Rhodovulum sp. ES.010]SIO37340.1 3-deoxy-D-manno-octulosonic-acid transferase [Rhodovulum sp. ES.010]